MGTLGGYNVESDDLTGSLPGIDVSDVGRDRPLQTVDKLKYNAAFAKLFPTLQKLGFSALRPGQDRAVLNLLMGKDTLCFLPTGFGKTAIYIVPALCLNYKCLIFSPLVSLMKDQVESLWRMDLAAAQISGGQTPAENDMALHGWEAGELQFLLVAPERMGNAEFMRVMMSQKPDMVVTDEAHALSMWGDSFRPAYTKIGSFIDMCNPSLVLAMTATATTSVESDIRKVLRIDKASKIVYYPARSNLILKSRQLESTWDVKNLLNTMDGPVIVYCPTKKLCEELYQNFGQDIQGESLVYHGGLQDGERTTGQELFMSNQIRVMFSTNAFGMGVNKPDIRGIIHCGYSKSVDSYVQEAGRAGRDGLESQCVLLYDDDSYKTQMYLIELSYPRRALIERVMEYLQVRMDRTGTVCLTAAQIAEEINARERSGQVASALSILARYGAVERSKDEEVLSRMRILRPHEDPAMQSRIDLIASIGVKAADGYYDFSMTMFVSQSGMKDRKARDTLTLLDKGGYVQYTKPFKGKTTRVLKGIEVVDFDGLEDRYREEVKKLNVLKDYALTADEAKHQFLLDYFGIK